MDRENIRDAALMVLAGLMVFAGLYLFVVGANCTGEGLVFFNPLPYCEPTELENRSQ